MPKRSKSVADSDDPGPRRKPHRLRRFCLFLKRGGGALVRYVKLLFNPSLSRKRRAAYAAAGLFATTLAAGLVLFLALVVMIPFTPGTKSLQQMKVQRPTVLLATSGEELKRFQQLNREWVSLDAISPHVAEALVATEDHRFYEHSGVDARRLAASIVYTTLGDQQGGSTITMQLVRNLYPRRIGRSWGPVRKLKEVVTAFKVERTYEKDEILETYLNTVPFLYNAVGIEKAARTYFGKSARRLDVLESATLVGMLKATSYYNPVRNPERARYRRNVVLGQMVKHGVLPQEDYDHLQTQPLRIHFQRQRMSGGQAPHFTEYVRQWLEEWAEKEGYNLYTDGLKVHTTLDLRLQRLAEAAVARQGQALQKVADVEWERAENRLLSESPHDYGSPQTRPFAYFWSSQTDLVNSFIRSTPRYARGLAAGQEPADLLASLRANGAFTDSLRTIKTRLETGFVALDPRSGQVKAWVGSRDYARDKYDHVAQARRQPGSTFKPFVYAAALEAGYTPEDRLPDRPVEVKVKGGQVWRPINAGGFSNEDITLHNALARSKNSISVQLIEEVGPRRTARLARRMGVNRSKLEAVPSLALGTSAVTLLEMVSAYATIADGGQYREPVFVTHIEDPDGNVVATFETEAERAFSERSAQALLDMMRGVVDHGTGQRIRTVFGVRADVAGKTGTTQDNADGWFLLIHPHLVAGSWVGFNDPRVTFRSDYWGQGAHNALYVVGDFYRHALRQGRIDPRPSLAPVPIFEQKKPSFFARAGAWFGETWAGIQEQFQREDENVADASRPSPQPQPRPGAENNRSDPQARAPERRRDRTSSRRGDDWQELEQLARDVGRIVGEVDRLLNDGDGAIAEVYRDQVEAYIREAERHLRDQQHREHRRRSGRSLEDHLGRAIEDYLGDLDREQRADIERALSELKREMRGLGSGW